MSTAEQLFNADVKESSARHNRYWKASSLPTMERLHAEPGHRTYRRDKVLMRILNLEMQNIIGSVIEINVE